jgi:hypothetical protein
VNEPRVCRAARIAACETPPKARLKRIVSLDLLLIVTINVLVVMCVYSLIVLWGLGKG